MILKWLVTGFVVFSIYRFFIKNKMVDAPNAPTTPPPSPGNMDGEFIDYEEVVDK